MSPRAPFRNPTTTATALLAAKSPAPSNVDPKWRCVRRASGAKQHGSVAQRGYMLASNQDGGEASSSSAVNSVATSPKSWWASRRMQPRPRSGSRGRACTIPCSWRCGAARNRVFMTAAYQ